MFTPWNLLIAALDDFACLIYKFYHGLKYRALIHSTYCSRVKYGHEEL